MSSWYLDTSAALKLVIDERESSVLVDHPDTETPDLVACLLLETELRRAAQRRGDLTREMVTQLIERVNLFEVPTSLFREAGLLGGAHLRSLDALHLAAAIRIGADAIVTYDHRMAEASRDLGFAVIAPA
ncbi:type II toxin-antitoxin system VapC family toxin [Janibacter limosus]|uniref:Type II toxin-antitoxin system VapC family toxin n=1 Tax=Janibacter limosus TaxID=53458 RepID=A0AC61U3T5_9MICO|nr:type II toxin-antitoxin system VapC family toxin [Janibacter limosus]UUZ44633.1 type II toxin-antitoxin system VapC family toxin [Janibacter limosus]